jgi:hypothetical protein
MTESALETYLATVDDRHRPLVLALDEAVRAAGDQLESRYAYRMLLYSRPGQPRSRWICGISTSSKRVHLRFLFGTSMPDPRGILRGGTATLMSIDYASLDDVDAAVATAYVRDALAVEDAGGPSAG